MATPGHKTSLRLTLTPEERATLTSWQRRTSWPHVLVRRARLLLLLADGASVTHAARTVQMSRRHIYKWVARWEREGLAGLRDKKKGRKTLDV